MIDTKNLSGDIFGGITAAVVALPWPWLLVCSLVWVLSQDCMVPLH